jgi:sphingosine kinase
MFIENNSDFQVLTEIAIQSKFIVVRITLEYQFDSHECEETRIEYKDIVGLKIINKDLVINYFSRCHDESIQFNNIVINYFSYSNNEEHYNKIVKKIDIKSNNYLFIINPVAGSGEGKTVFTNQIESIFNKSFHTFQTYYTTSKENTEEILKMHKNTINGINSFKAVIVVGGDGTVFDVVQALKKLDVSIPIAIIPVGSGNGLAKSIMGKTPLTATVIDYVYKILYGDTCKLDVSLCTGSWLEESSYSILGQAWGMPSNVDIKSEYLRWMGNLRFTVQTIVELYNMNTYSGVLRYLPYSDKTKQLITHARKTKLNYDNLSEWKSITGNFVMIWACQTPYMSDNALVAPNAKLDDGKIHLVIIKSDKNKPISQYQLLTFFWNLHDGKHVNSDFVEIIPVLGYDLTVKKSESGNITVDGELVDYTKLCVMMDDQIDIIY